MAVVNLFFFAALLLGPPSFAGSECEAVPRSGVALVDSLRGPVLAATTYATECFQQEILDGVLAPYRVQAVAMKLCAEEKACVQFLRDEAARVSTLPAEKFAHLSTTLLWGEIAKYAGLNRIRPPQLKDLPLQKDPVEVFEKLKKERADASSMNASEASQWACAGVVAIVGPGKFKSSLNLIRPVAMTFKVEQGKEVVKLISKNRLPPNVRDKFLKWSAEVEEKGLDEVRKVPGYHDEPIKAIAGRRSVRMGDGFRACYESVVENGVTLLKVITISSDHSFTGYCR